jgi:hypothetical protein
MAVDTDAISQPAAGRLEVYCHRTRQWVTASKRRCSWPSVGQRQLRSWRIDLRSHHQLVVIERLHHDPTGKRSDRSTGGEQRGREQRSAPKNHVAGSTERMLWTAELMDKNADLLVAMPETAHAAMLTNCVMRTSVNQGAALNATKWLRITSKLVITNRNQEVAHEQCD